jgi:hypothetical protein
MRLFGKVAGRVDRLDRAGWLTMPFDLALARPAPPSSSRVAPLRSTSARLGVDPLRSTSARLGVDPLRSTSARAGA